MGPKIPPMGLKNPPMGPESTPLGPWKSSHGLQNSPHGILKSPKYPSGMSIEQKVPDVKFVLTVEYFSYTEHLQFLETKSHCVPNRLCCSLHIMEASIIVISVIGCLKDWSYRSVA